MDSRRDGLGSRRPGAHCTGEKNAAAPRPRQIACRRLATSEHHSTPIHQSPTRSALDRKHRRPQPAQRTRPHRLTPRALSGMGWALTPLPRLKSADAGAGDDAAWAREPGTNGVVPALGRNVRGPKSLGMEFAVSAKDSRARSSTVVECYGCLCPTAQLAR